MYIHQTKALRVTHRTRALVFLHADVALFAFADQIDLIVAAHLLAIWALLGSWADAEPRARCFCWLAEAKVQAEAVATEGWAQAREQLPTAHMQ